MANWRKKVEAGGGADLRPGEFLIAAVMLQPDGLTGSMVAKGVGGAVGGALADRRRGPSDAPIGMASVLPAERCWLGVTPTRLLVWRHGELRGRPKGLVTEMPVRDLHRVDLDKRKTSHAVTLTFADGSQRSYEAPRLVNDTEGFADAINQP